MGPTTPPMAAERPAAADRPAPSLRRFALAAVAASLPEGAAAGVAELQPLLDHLAAVRANGQGWAAGLIAYLREPAGEDGPLLALAGELGLTPLETLSVALAAAVEDDLLLGRALAHLQAPLGGSRPTVGLLATALAEAGPVGLRPIDALITGAAVRGGLLSLLGEGAPLPERPVAVPGPLCLALAGHDGAWPGASIGLADGPAVPLPESTLLQARRQALALATAPGRALVLRARSSAEGRAVAAAIAAALGCRPLFIETDKLAGLGAWLVLRRLLPIFCAELAPGERRVLPPLPAYRGPLLAVCGPDGTVEQAGGAALSWSLEVPPREERRQLWELAIGEPALAAGLARDHRHGSGRIAHLGRLARHRAALEGRTRPTRPDVVAASWSGEGVGLETLAQPLADAIPDEALVMTPTLRQELETLLLRCRARDGLVEGLGASATARYHPGVRALFVGPSGAGKTLAAGWLATRLGLPLYRVDLAAVTSKYIGETEKNLAQLLARAEQAEVVLLFDEADSLFGKRTEIREANDRFANAQTNYLLQRIESYDGITLLTSNSRGRFDAAFSRRLDLIVEFPLPGPDERRALWESHLGSGHALDSRALNQLAALADLGGGHIRNAVLTAAVLAHSQHRPIGFADVLRGVEAEYRKLGRQMPVELELDR